MQKIAFERFPALESQQQEEINSLYTNIRFSGHGIRSIGVTYGYGTRAELTTAGADLIVDTPSELVYIN